MDNENIQLELDLNLNPDTPGDVFINKVKDLSKKHNISFIEALEVIKYLDGELDYLKDTIKVLYQIDENINILAHKTGKGLTNIADEMRSY